MLDNLSTFQVIIFSFCITPAEATLTTKWSVKYVQQFKDVQQYIASEPLSY